MSIKPAVLPFLARCRVWSAPDMAPLQVLNNGSGWITDCALLEGHAAKKLAVAAHDRTVHSPLLCAALSWSWLAKRRPGQHC
jgi:hypothetical protein